jgi:pectate lyase
VLIEGYGENVTGGTGGATHTVDSLVWDASTEGTLPWALAQPGPRIIQFSVNGVIEPPSRFVIPNDTTLDGSTAPAPGVCIKGVADVGSASPASWPSNIIVSHMRFRPGGISEGDCITLMGTHIVLDHCSLSWGNDEALGFKNLYSEGDPGRYITVQWCILSDSEKGCLCSPAGHKTTFHHNIWAHNYHRNPVVAGGDFAHLVDIRNNVVYDFGEFGIGFKGYVSANVVGNYMILREARFEKAPVFSIQDGDEVPADPDLIQIYCSGNSGPGTRGDYGLPYSDEWEEVRRDDLSVASLDFRALTPFDCPAVTTTSAGQAYTDVLAGAGATLPELDIVS